MAAGCVKNANIAGGIRNRRLKAYHLLPMPQNPLDLPMQIAKAFVKDMRAYFAEPNAIKRNEIAGRPSLTSAPCLRGRTNPVAINAVNAATRSYRRRPGSPPASRAARRCCRADKARRPHHSRKREALPTAAPGGPRRPSGNHHNGYTSCKYRRSIVGEFHKRATVMPPQPAKRNSALDPETELIRCAARFQKRVVDHFDEDAGLLRGFNAIGDLGELARGEIGIDQGAIGIRQRCR
jgi:hypothetical protein